MGGERLVPQRFQETVDLFCPVLGLLPRHVPLLPPAGWRPAALRPLCSSWRAGRPPWRPGQRHPPTVGRPRHTELLRTVARISTQRLCSLVSETNIITSTQRHQRNGLLTNSPTSLSILFPRINVNTTVPSASSAVRHFRNTLGRSLKTVRGINLF